ncbi:MAG: hypothetical protein ACOCYT_00155 [Chloroflexota bacterium]
MSAPSPSKTAQLPNAVLDFGDSLDADTKNELIMYVGCFGSDFYQVIITMPSAIEEGTYSRFGRFRRQQPADHSVGDRHW